MRLLFVVLLVAAVVTVAIGCTSSQPETAPKTPIVSASRQSSGTASPGPTRTLAATSRTQWTAAAVWDWSDAAGLWEKHCGLTRFNSPQLAGHPCVVDVMRQAGASDQAIDFYTQQGYFLSFFQELGVVDYGRGTVPWINMGRPSEQFLLNGFPAVLDVSGQLWAEYLSSVKIPALQGSSSLLGYKEFLDKNPDADFWPEYGGVASTSLSTSGDPILILDAPFKAGRPGPVLGYMPVEFEFTPIGFLLDVRVLPFKAP